MTKMSELAEMFKEYLYADEAARLAKIDFDIYAEVLRDHYEALKRAEEETAARPFEPGEFVRLRASPLNAGQSWYMGVAIVIDLLEDRSWYGLHGNDPVGGNSPVGRLDLVVGVLAGDEKHFHLYRVDARSYVRLSAPAPKDKGEAA